MLVLVQAPAFRSAAKACQSIYAPAGPSNYVLKYQDFPTLLS